ncbi:signal transduction histidine kinase [Fictibacillus macauensis ZFHKF-1]|uniref:histidine kinase n=2 Tax=Fictibacillus TaxID=1329200 RepID=I8J5L0_9BACL|nr:signal transduction histidine kinase [Fictibacillus macauensis ZFHKF-1]
MVSFFVYIALNVALYLVGRLSRMFLLLGSIILIVVGSIHGYALLLLLLPFSVCEVFDGKAPHVIVLLVVSLLPLFFFDIEPFLYSASAAGSCLLWKMNTTYYCKLVANEQQLDQLRSHVQRLNVQVHENEEDRKQSQYMSRLEERNRISQGIHDHIGHSMTGALIQMEAAKTLMMVDQHKAKELLDNAITISKEGIEDIRLTLKNMKPPIEQLGVQRLKQKLDAFTRNTHIKTSFVFSGNLDVISALQWKVISENVTEALTNALKYGNVTEIAVSITVYNKLIKVVVKDNGVGATKLIKGLGIVGMEERAALLHGTVIIDGSDGFSVTLLLPHERS